MSHVRYMNKFTVIVALYPLNVKYFLKNKKYYEFGDNKTEQMAKEYWKRIKGE